MAIVLFDITSNLKRDLENEISNKDLDSYELLNLFFNKIYEVMGNNNIRIDELIE